LKTKCEVGVGGVSGEKNGFPLFRRGEVDTYLPIFSIDCDPERFSMRGLGPPRDMDPRLVALLNMLFGDDVYMVLSSFHIEEKADRVIVRVASISDSVARKMIYGSRIAQQNLYPIKTACIK